MKPSKIYFALDFYPSSIIFDISFSTSLIGTSPSKGSSSEPSLDFTFSYIIFISIGIKLYLICKWSAILVFPVKDCPMIIPKTVFCPIFSRKRAGSQWVIVFNLNSFWNKESILNKERLLFFISTI